MHVTNHKTEAMNDSQRFRWALIQILFPRENESKEDKEIIAKCLSLVTKAKKIDYDKPGDLYGVPLRFEMRNNSRHMVFSLKKEDILDVIPELNPDSIDIISEVWIPFVDTSEVDRAKQVENPVPEEKKQQA